MPRRSTKPPRIRRSREQWQALLHEFERSGLSAKAFCEAHGIGYASFLQWRSRLSRETEAPTFVEITPETAGRATAVDADSAWSVELQIGAHCVLRIR